MNDDAPPLPGRPKLYDKRIVLPLEVSMAEALDAVLRDGEGRVEAIREAIGREIARRRREEPKGDPRLQAFKATVGAEIARLNRLKDKKA